MDGIKEIFIPDKEVLQSTFNDCVKDIKMKFGFDTSVFEDLFDGERPVEDVEGNYTISGVGTFKLKFLDTSFLKDGISFFRPLIRGFLVLMLLLYNIKQLIGFFGYDAGVVQGRSEYIQSERRQQK